MKKYPYEEKYSKNNIWVWLKPNLGHWKNTKEKVAAVLNIKGVGAMSEKGRKDIAEWLEMQAQNILKVGKDYTKKGNFTAKYLYNPNPTLK